MCIVNPPTALPPTLPVATPDYAALAQRVRELAREFGFQRCGITDIDLGQDEAHLRDWLAKGLYGSMDWMARHGDLRARPDELHPRHGAGDLGRAGLRPRRATKPGRRSTTASAPMSPATRWVATTTS